MGGDDGLDVGDRGLKRSGLRGGYHSRFRVWLGNGFLGFEF